jgi:hypothetical protein
VLGIIIINFGNLVISCFDAIWCRNVFDIYISSLIIIGSAACKWCFLGFEVDRTKSTQHLVGRAKKARYFFFIKRKFLKNRNQNDKTKRN